MFSGIYSGVCMVLWSAVGFIRLFTTGSSVFLQSARVCIVVN